MTKKPAGLPPLTAELVLIGAALQAQREECGQKWCFTHGIGQMRRILFASGVLMRAREAKEFLKGMCEECRYNDCPMKRWPVIPAPSASQAPQGTAKI